MLQLSTMTTIATKIAGVAGLYLKKRSPEILLGTGVASGVAAVATAIVIAPKASKVVEECKQSFAVVKEAKDGVADGTIPEEKYSMADYRKDLAIVSLQSALKIGKAYAPVLALEAVSILAVLASFKVLKSRNLALAAAYAGVKKLAETRKKFISDYRDEVKKKIGEKEEATINEKVVTKQHKDRGDKIGKNGSPTNRVLPADPYLSENARCFCEDNTWMWRDNAEQNMMTLKGIQAHANDMLRVKGHLFLNEVYDMLGFDHTPEGAVTGWVENGRGDGYVDFGFTDMSRAQTRMFIDGSTPDVWLDFNVDGVIYDLI